MKRVTVLLSVLLLIIGAFFVLPNFWRGGGRTANTNVPSAIDLGASDNRASAVEVRVINRSSLKESIKTGGYVRSPAIYGLRPAVTGSIVALRVREGERVKAGQELMEIDSKRFRVEYENARSQLDQALLQYALALRDQEQGGALESAHEPNAALASFDTTYLDDREARDLLLSDSRRRLLAFRTGVTRARTVYETAKQNLENAKPRSLFDGVIADLSVSKFGFVQEGDLVLSVVSLSPLEIEAGVLESEVRYVQENASADISVSSVHTGIIKGRVATVSPIIDRQSGTCRVRVQFMNPKSTIKPGMFADVKITTNVHAVSLLLPRQALLEREGRPFAFVCEGGRAKWRYVKTGAQNTDYVEITDGLENGDTVIVSGHLYLNNDSPVMVVARGSAQ